MKLNEDAPPAEADSTYPKHWPREKVTAACTRFGARFRIAKAFTSVTFAEGIGRPTATTYSALIRFMTVYSAWELFTGALGLTSDKCLGELEQKYAAVGVLTLVDQDRQDRGTLLRFLVRHVTDAGLKAQMASMLEGKERSPRRLAEAIRHVYVHGVLSARPWRLGHGRLEALANALSEYMLTIMDEEAGKRACARLQSKKKAEPAARANDHGCHVPC